MGLKRKDFQKVAVFLKEFLLKLNEDPECAELRDTLTLALLHMQKYYRLLQCRTQERTSQHQLTLSARGLSPMTPFVDAPDKFQWKWVHLDSPKYSSTPQDEGFYHLPDVILAVRDGNLQGVISFIKQDPALIDETDSLGRTGLFYAIHFMHLNILKFLLNNGADPNAVAHDGSSSIHKACHDGNHVALELLIAQGGDIHVQDTQLRAPIHWAVTTPRLECLQTLIQNEADSQARDKDGLTPSMWACRLDHIDHFELLYESVKNSLNKEEVEIDDSGRTWIHWAVRRTEPLKCLRLLLNKDSAALKDEEGKTVILVAAESGSFPACKLIFEMAGPNVISDRDNMDRSALHLATIGGHGNIVNFLLENGGDLELPDRFQATAWDYAKNKQLHYCQLIMMSHRHQSIQSSPRDARFNSHGPGNSLNPESWMKRSDFTPDSTPRPYGIGPRMMGLSSNGDVSSRYINCRNPALDELRGYNDGKVNNRGNNAVREDDDHHNLHQMKDDDDGDGDGLKTDVRFQDNVREMLPKPFRTSGAGNPGNLERSCKDREPKPCKDIISSPCPPKRPRTASCLARASFQHRSLSESFDRHISRTRSVDYTDHDPTEISRSEGTESRLGVYEKNNLAINNRESQDHQSHDQNQKNNENPLIHLDSQEDLGDASVEMDESNIEEEDPPPSLMETNINDDDPNDIHPSSPQISAVIPRPRGKAPTPLSSSHGSSDLNISQDFPYPKPRPPSASSPLKRTPHPPGMLLNRRPLLSRNHPKTQPVLKQPSKALSGSGNALNPKIANASSRSEPPSLTGGPEAPDYEEPNCGPLPWQGLAPGSGNPPTAPTAPIDPILPQQEPLSRYLHRGPQQPAGALSKGSTWLSDQPNSTTVAERPDPGFTAQEQGIGTKGVLESQNGSASQQYLSPPSSTSSLSLTPNRNSIFHASTPPSGLENRAQKADLRRLPSALIPLTSTPSLPQSQPVPRKKKKKRKKQENQEAPFEKIVLEGKCLQNVPNQMGIKGSSSLGLSGGVTESKKDRFNPGMDSKQPSTPVLNNPKNANARTKEPPFSKVSSPPVAKTRCSSGALRTNFNPHSNSRNNGFSRETHEGQHPNRNEQSLNDLMTVGSQVFAKKKPGPLYLDTLPSTPVADYEETSQDSTPAKTTLKDKWSLPENGLLNPIKPSSPFSQVDTEVVRSKPPLPYARKSLPL